MNILMTIGELNLPVKTSNFMSFTFEKGLLTCQKSLGEIGLDKQICMSFTFKKGL